MKVLFGIDITDNRKNETVNGNEFITASNSEEELKKYDEATGRLKKNSDASGMPMILRIIMSLAFFLGNITLIAIVSGSLFVGPVQAFFNAPYVFFLCPAGYVTFFILASVFNRKAEKAGNDPETADAVMNARETNRELYHSLGVPDDAAATEVLMFFYKTRDGKLTMYSKNQNSYTNITMRAFRTDAYLCFADISDLYSVPLACIKDIRVIDDKTITIAAWNKDEPISAEKYRKYCINQTNVGQYSVRGYCVLEFEYEGENWEIWFPPYEEEALRMLLK